MNPALAELLQAALTNHQGGNHSTALMQYKIALKHFGDSSLAWECYSVLLFDIQRFDDCIDACRHALELDPSCNSARKTLRVALNHMLVTATKSGDLGNISTLAEQLVEYLDDAPVMQPLELSSIKLLLGEFRQGWSLFESRFELPNYSGAKALLRYPRWDGKPYPGKTLLLHSEAGFGDSIMMMRYLEMVKSLGGTLILYMPDALVSLAKECHGPDMVFVKTSKAVSFDYQLPMMSLPFIFDTNLETIPNKVPYIHLPSHVPNKDAIDARLARGTKKIGLVWAGQPGYKRDSERSMAPETLRPLEAAPDTSWFCLQRDGHDAVPFPSATPLGDLFDTFVDTAYAVSQMDTIVTVDTSIAHLAGAMGANVKLMVSCLPCWRWLLWRSDSPWYPTLKIYRQPSPGDWQSVVQQVLADLVAEN